MAGEEFADEGCGVLVGEGADGVGLEGELCAEVVGFEGRPPLEDVVGSVAEFGAAGLDKVVAVAEAFDAAGAV